MVIINWGGQFIQEASAKGFQQVHGHHSVGGLRISLYNPVPDAAVEGFVNFMKDFQLRSEQSDLMLMSV